MNINRRTFIKASSIASVGLMANSPVFANEYPTVRVPLSQRKFSSPIIEATIKRMKTSIKDAEVAWMFENCFPNTLDTTVNYQIKNNRPDTFVITGDIHAMWLRAHVLC
eukprot:Opistho-2@37667